MGEKTLSLLALLREATNLHHRRLENNRSLARLLAPDLQIAEYRCLLARMLGFYQPWEQALWPALQPAMSELEVQQRVKTPLLESDLLGLGLSSADLEALPRIGTPVINSFATAVGCFYVFEGATLGGQIICRHLAESLPVSSAYTRFYLGYGASTGRFWADARRFIESRDFGAQQQAEAVDSAIAIFMSMDRWLAINEQDQ